jgi:ATP-dependent protease ClpP protease subunit
MARFWNFIRNQAAENAEEEIELRIEGEIIDDVYAWLYEWFGISASSPNAFKQELNQYKGKNIVVWIDSYGGSVFAAAGIYNALMEHKKSGAKVTSKVTKAMSAATIPMMAADERLMSPGGIYMMHNPLTEVYGYATDLRKAADVLDVVKETIINAYQLGTGKSRAKISSLMDEETYMDARTAIKEGFATGMLYSGEQKEEKNVDDIVNFTFNRLEIKNAAKDSMKKFFEVAKKNEAQNAPASSAPQANEKINQPDANNTNNNQKEAKKIMNLEELRAAYPDLVAQIENNAKEEGRKEERQRIKDIEAISNNIDSALVNKAKFDEPMNAEKLAFEALKNDGQKGKEYLENVKTEAQNSGTQNVVAAANNVASTGEQKPKKIENVVAEVGAKFERSRKGEK